MRYKIPNTYVLYKIFLVLQIFFHPECCLKKLPNNQTIPGANIALLELKEAVNISDFINIACIDGTKEPNNETTVILCANALDHSLAATTMTLNTIMLRYGFQVK